MDPARVGVCAWLGLLHSAAKQLDERGFNKSLESRKNGTIKLSKLIKALAAVFPCSHCRQHIVLNWDAPNVPKDDGCSFPMQALMRNFHNLVSSATKKGGGAPSMLSLVEVVKNNHKLWTTKVWRLWFGGFLLYTAANCEAFGKTTSKGPAVLFENMSTLVRAAKECGLDVPELTGPATTCDSVWELTFGYVSKMAIMSGFKGFGRSQYVRKLVMEASSGSVDYVKHGKNIVEQILKNK
jgi:hypothetical protein